MPRPDRLDNPKQYELFCLLPSTVEQVAKSLNTTNTNILTKIKTVPWITKNGRKAPLTPNEVEIERIVDVFVEGLITEMNTEPTTMREYFYQKALIKFMQYRHLYIEDINEENIKQ